MQYTISSLQVHLMGFPYFSNLKLATSVRTPSTFKAASPSFVSLFPKLLYGVIDQDEMHFAPSFSF